MFPAGLFLLAETVLERSCQAGWRLAVAESCTGGLVAGCLTAVAGSSKAFERGFVTYSNEAKIELLDVPAELLGAYGAVSCEVAEAMALGAIAHSRADLAVSVTGIAGPGGQTITKPVGLVHVGVARRGGPVTTHRDLFLGNRNAIRLAAVERALTLMRDAIPTTRIA
ncbi:MAG: nicotinamide-nucleotide amidohydrolase family protein [Azospirillum sp.]|nr:nicotinamide-nucleotide amidohydrolase family protein [Azospirillum sp.]